MIIKHYDLKNGTCYFAADDVSAQFLQLKGSAQSGSVEKIEEKTSFDFGRNRENYEFLCAEIVKLTGWNCCTLEFVKNGNDYEGLENCVAVLLKNEGKKSHRILVFNENVFLMSDNGKTIERII